MEKNSFLYEWLTVIREKRAGTEQQQKESLHSRMHFSEVNYLLPNCLWGLLDIAMCPGKKMSAHKSLKTTRRKKTSLVLHGKGWMLKSWHLYRSQRNTPQQDTKMHLLHRDGTPPTFSLVFVVIRRLPWDFSLSASLSTTCTWARWKRERGERDDVEKHEKASWCLTFVIGVDTKAN